jgi:hypothetical protein
MRRDESAQMMLLAAVVLIIGFIALAGMVGRVGQLAGQSTKEQQRPLVREIEPMLGAVNLAIATPSSGLQSITPALTTAAYETAVTGILRHLRQIEAGQGFLMDWTLDCSTAAVPSTGIAKITLYDGALKVTVVSNSFTRPNCNVISG